MAMGRPRATLPSAVIATTVSGTVITSSRQAVCQLRQPGGRRSLSPAPINDTITTNSVRRSAATVSGPGRGPSRSMGSAKIAIPIATITIGNALDASVFNDPAGVVSVDARARELTYRASLGYQAFGPDAQPHDLLGGADRAMYQAKRLRADVADKAADPKARRA